MRGTRPFFWLVGATGTTRAMMVAEALERRRTRLAGVVLMSGGFNVGQSVPRPLNQALAISEDTAGAHYHKRLSPELQTLSRDAAITRAVEWARRAGRARPRAAGESDSLTADGIAGANQMLHRDRSSLCL